MKNTALLFLAIPGIFFGIGGQAQVHAQHSANHAKDMPGVTAGQTRKQNVRPPAVWSEEEKIEYLIALIRTMPEGTKFLRNGREYGSGKAAEHLSMKYRRAKKHAATAELFIENIASRSSISGRDYSILFFDGTTVTAREFFTEALKKITK